LAEKPSVGVFDFQGAMGLKKKLGPWGWLHNFIRIQRDKEGPKGLNELKIEGPTSQSAWYK
jgi:hypothetical protein